MASSMAIPGAYLRCQYFKPLHRQNYYRAGFSSRCCRCQQQQQQQKNDPTKPTGLIARREIILRSSELAVIMAIFNLSGKRPDYLGVQKNQQQLALCPATKTCISTSEDINDSTHYAPPWNYNGGRRKKAVVSKQVAMEELVQVITSTKPDKYSPRVVERKSDYLHVEYQSPILGLVDDVEFWFPPGGKSVVEYRSASRVGDYDFYVNRKRIKVQPEMFLTAKVGSQTLSSCLLQSLRQDLEKKGWTSQNPF